MQVRTAAMSDLLKRAVRDAVLRLLGPLVKLLLDAGIGVGEFMSIVKVAYVREASARGSAAESRRPNVTRIAVITGLTRIEVAALLQSGDEEPAASDRGRQRAERVLSGWWNDADFHDEQGQPAVLSEKGGRRSFAALCERYGGGPGFAAILDELIRVRAVSRTREGQLRALSRTYATVRWDPEGVAAVGEELADHCATLVQNLRNPTRALLSRRVANTQLDPRYGPMLIRELEERAATLIESMDDALNHPSYTVKPPDSAPAVRLGVGIYLFEDTTEPPSHSPRPAGERQPRAQSDRRSVARRRSGA